MRLGTHHDQSDRTLRLVSVTSKVAKGHGTLRQLPVEAVTLYLIGGAT